MFLSRRRCGASRIAGRGSRTLRACELRRTPPRGIAHRKVARARASGLWRSVGPTDRPGRGPTRRGGRRCREGRRWHESPLKPRSGRLALLPRASTPVQGGLWSFAPGEVAHDPKLSTRRYCTLHGPLFLGAGYRGRFYPRFMRLPRQRGRRAALRSARRRPRAGSLFYQMLRRFASLKCRPDGRLSQERRR